MKTVGKLFSLSWMACSIALLPISADAKDNEDFKLVKTLLPKVPGNSFDGDAFGRSVCMSGDYAFVSAPFASPNGVNEAGAVYVYKRHKLHWVNTQIITTGGAFDQLGNFSVQSQGDWLVISGIGTPIGPIPVDDAINQNFQGSVLVYRLKQKTGKWELRQVLNQNTHKVGAIPNFSSFGECVRLDLDKGVMLVGSALQTQTSFYGTSLTNAGVVFAFELDKKKHRWEFKQKITSPDGVKENAQFGTTIALRHDLALISAGSPPLSTTIMNGAVYLYQRQKGKWTFLQKVIGNQVGPTPPNSLIGITIGDGFGNSLALDKNWAVIGAGREAESATKLFRGAVYFYHIDRGSETVSKAAKPSTDKVSETKADENKATETPVVTVDTTPSLKFKQKFFSKNPSSQLTGAFAAVVKDRQAFVGDPLRTGPAGIIEGGVILFAYRKGKWHQDKVIHNPHGNAFGCFGTSISLHKGHLLVGQDPTAVFTTLVPTPVPAPSPTANGKALIFKQEH